MRQRGSHIVMQKQISGSTVTVPVPDHKEIRQAR
ncbi:type II toxin-antitoxin system HicA family toxin [Nitrosococcus oceani]|nr:type II toxin-antitoxin system HicA family toxin [Nitrosococcus oceani]